MESRKMPPPQASARQTEMGDTFNRVLFSAQDAMQEGQIPFALIGGIAVSGMGRPRSTHDIDIFVRPEDAEAALEALGRHGFETERTDVRWLFKGWKDDMMVDIIFKSQGDIYFDTEMQQSVRKIHYHGRDIPAVSPEDLIIIKAVVHSEVGPHHWHDALAILSHATVNWPYLMRRARRAPRRLLALLIYAQSNDIWIPNQVITELYGVIFAQNYQQNHHVPGPSSAESPHHIFSAPPDTIPTPAVTPPAAAPASVASSPSSITSSSETKPQRPTATAPAQDLAVAVAPARGAPPEIYLLGHIQEKLSSDTRTCTADIELTIENGRVVVRGEAPTHGHRRSIEAVIRDVIREAGQEGRRQTGVRAGAAASPAPDFEIDNRLSIVEMAEPELGETV